jgi:hypothetical protein
VLLIAESLVGVNIHELINLVGVRELDLDHPASALGILVDETGLVSKFLVDLGNDTSDRGVDVVSGLDRLDSSEGAALGNVGILRWRNTGETVRKQILGNKTRISRRYVLSAQVYHSISC